jgi:hypothetical protein
VTLVALVLVAAVSFGLYQLKYDVQRLEAELAGLNRELIGEREAIRVLEAEWSFLNRPQRLQDLAARHLELAPAVVDRAAALERLPYRRRGDHEPAAAAPLPSPSTPPLPVPRPASPTGGAMLASTGAAQ